MRTRIQVPPNVARLMEASISVYGRMTPSGWISDTSAVRKPGFRTEIAGGRARIVCGRARLAVHIDDIGAIPHIADILHKSHRGKVVIVGRDQVRSAAARILGAMFPDVGFRTEAEDELISKNVADVVINPYHRLTESYRDGMKILDILKNFKNVGSAACVLVSIGMANAVDLINAISGQRLRSWSFIFCALEYRTTDYNIYISQNNQQNKTITIRCRRIYLPRPISPERRKYIVEPSIAPLVNAALSGRKTKWYYVADLNTTNTRDLVLVPRGEHLRAIPVPVTSSIKTADVPRDLAEILVPAWNEIDNEHGRSRT